MPKSFPFAVILWRKITFSFRIQPQKCHAWRDTTYETSRTKIIINESETCSNPRKVFTFLLEFRRAWYGRRLERVLYYYTVVCCNGCLCSLLFVAFYDQETNKGSSIVCWQWKSKKLWEKGATSFIRQQQRTLSLSVFAKVSEASFP